MEPTYDCIRQISRDKVNWHIRVRVTRMWKSININKANELMSVDFIILDENDDHILCTIPKNYVEHFLPLLQEGNVYNIKNFKVMQNKTSYRPVHHENMITFLRTTEVKEVDSMIVDISLYKFEFITYKDIVARYNDNTYLTDVYGKLNSISFIEHLEVRGRSINMRRLIVEISRDEKIAISLWSDVASQIDEEVCLKAEKPIWIIVTSTIVKKYMGKCYLSSTNATKLYLNIKFPEEEELARYTNNSTVTRLKNEASSKQSNEERKKNNRLSIAEIINVTKDADTKITTFTCIASIIKVATNRGWFYISCNHCNKKLNTVNSSYRCDNCGNNSEYPQPKYRLELEVTDSTATTTFVVLDGEAQKIVKVPIKQVMEKWIEKGINEEAIPMQLESIVGCKYIFEIRLDKFNFQYQLQKYTVTKIFDTAIGDDAEDPSKIETTITKPEEDNIAELHTLIAPSKKARIEILEK